MWIETPASGRGTTVAFTLPVAVDVPSAEPEHALATE
jgi:hypothetical protein